MARLNQNTKNPTPISGVIEAVIKSLGLTGKYHGWLVVTNWSSIVGEHIAKVSHAFRYDDGTLFVAVRDASWRHNLSMEIENILAKIRTYPYGRAIKQIRLVSGEKGYSE